MGLIVPASIHRARQPPNIEVVFREIQVLLVVRHSVQLYAVDRVSLSAREGRIVDHEIVVQRVGGGDRLVNQVSFPVTVQWVNGFGSSDATA